MTQKRKNKKEINVVRDAISLKGIAGHVLFGLAFLAISFVVLTATYDSVAQYLNGGNQYSSVSTSGTVVKRAMALISDLPIVDPGDIDTYDDPPCTTNCDPTTNYKHVNIYLAGSVGSSCLTSGCGGVAGDSGSLAVNLSQSSNATVIVGNSWNGKFRFDSAQIIDCGGVSPCWLSASPSNVSGIIKGPKTGNPTTGSVSLSRVGSPTSCAGGTCTAKVRVSGSIQDNWRGHFKWSCGGGDNPVGACPNASTNGPIQSEYRTITVSYTPPQAPPPATPLSCRATSAGPFYINQDIQFSVDGGNQASSYHWDSPGGTPASGDATFVAGWHASYTTTGSKTITVSQAGVSNCVITISVTSQVNPDFTLSIAPTSPAISQGQSINYTITATAGSGFNQNISFAPPQLPAGADLVNTSGQSITAPPTIIGGNGTSQFTMRTTGCGVAPGSYAISFSGTGGSQQHAVTSNLTVAQAANCAPPPSSAGYNCTPSGCQYVTSGATYTGANAQATCQSACTHKGCSNNACTPIAGSGTDSCTANSQCQTAAFSCSVAWNDQPVNTNGETYGTASLTINNLAAGKTCNFTCSPLAGCSATPITVSGARSYGPFKQGDTLSFACGTASGGTQTCGTHPAFSAPVQTCSAPNTTPYFTCQNNACARVDACGLSGGGCNSGNVGSCCGSSCGNNTLSCSMSVQPNTTNPSVGTVGYTVANSTADTRCTFSCSSNNPASPLCSASVTPGSGASLTGTYDYSGITTQRTLSLKCQKGTATAVNCSGATTIGAGSAPSCTPSKVLVSLNEYVDVTGSGGSGSLYNWSTNLDAQPSAATGFSVFHTKFTTAGTKTISVQSTGNGLAGTCSVTVSNSQPTCVITDITPDPIIAGPSATAYVSWTSSNATECTATQGPWYGPSLPPVGTQQSNIISSAQYTATTFGMKCKNAAYTAGGPECTRVLQIRSGTPSGVTTNLAASCVAAP